MASDVVYNKKTAKKVGWIMIILAMLAVVGGIFFSGPTNGADSPVHPITDANTIQFAASEIQNAKVGKPFSLNLTVHNGSNKAQQISEVTISSAFLGDGLSFVAGQPEMKRLSSVDWGTKYSLIQPAMPYDTSSLTVQLLAKKAGTYQGDIEVCFLSGKCARNSIRTVVIP